MTQAAVDEFMRRQSSDQGESQFKTKAAKGYPLTAAGFGYRNVRTSDGVGDWVIEPNEAEVARTIFRLYAAGHSVRTIVHHLNEIRALTPRLGKRGRGVWTPTAVNKILRRAVYRGELNSGHERDDLRIVDDATWQRVQGLLDANRSRALSPPTQRSSRWLLSSILRCPDCGGSMVAYGGFAYACYTSVANGSHVCANKLRLPLKKVDAAVVDQIVPFLTGPVVEKAVERASTRARANERGNPERRVATLLREIANIKAATVEGVFSPIEARERIVARQSEIDALHHVQSGQHTSAGPTLAALRTAATQLPTLFAAHPVKRAASCAHWFQAPGLRASQSRWTLTTLRVHYPRDAD